MEPFEASASNYSISSKRVEWQKKADGKVTPSQSSTAPSFRGASYQNLGSHQNDPNYGCPVAGSRTEYRGKQAGVHVSKEVVELCDIIRQLGMEQDDGTVVVLFGQLFEFYTKISNKLVGMLLRARRHGLVQFEGEMLFQRRDDHVTIHLVSNSEELMAQINRDKMELRPGSTNRTTPKF